MLSQRGDEALAEAIGMAEAAILFYGSEAVAVLPPITSKDELMTQGAWLLSVVMCFLEDADLFSQVADKVRAEMREIEKGTSNGRTH